LDVNRPINEIVATGAIAPFVHKMGLGTTRPVPMFGFKYVDDDDEDVKVEISETAKLDFGKLNSVKETDMDKVQQGSDALWNGKPAVVQRLSFKWDTRKVDVVLNVSGRIETKTLRLEE